MAKKLSPYCNKTLRRAEIQNVECKLSVHQTKKFHLLSGEEIPLRIFYYEVSASDGSYRRLTNEQDAIEAFEKLVEFEKRQTCIEL